LFHNSNVFGSCIIHILYTDVLKLKKNNSGAKRLMTNWGMAGQANLPERACRTCLEEILSRAHVNFQEKI
jgi:hypothetical protein